METALLGGGEGSSDSSRRDRRPLFNRTDAIAYGSTYQKAAALVDLVRFINCLRNEFHNNCWECCRIVDYVVIPYGYVCILKNLMLK